MKASNVNTGNIVKIDNTLYKVEEREIKGTGQFGKTFHFKLRSIPEGVQIERSFRNDEDLETVDLERSEAEYLYTDGNDYYFMDVTTYEQYPIPKEVIGSIAPFLKENTKIHIEFYKGNPVNVVFPEIVELKVVTAPPGIHEKDSTTMKTVTLENGMEILTPQFIKEGDIVKVNVYTHKYVERVKKE